MNQNQSVLLFFFYRYKVLAQQYKAMYPTLEIDIEGELVKLKVLEIKNIKVFTDGFSKLSFLQ